MSITFRKAGQDDLDTVSRIYEHIHTEEEHGRTTTGWKRGVYPTRATAEAALARGVKVTGATVHFVNEIPDGGEILLQKAVEIEPGDTPEVLQRRVMEQAEWQLLPRAAEIVCREIAEAEKEN